MTVACGTSPCSRVDEIDAAFRARIHTLRAVNEASISAEIIALAIDSGLGNAVIRTHCDNILRYLSRDDGFDLVEKGTGCLPE